MTDNDARSPHQAWARFRFSVVGPLLSAPPARGELRNAIEALAEKSWRHPVSGEWRRFSFSTIERWLYLARAAREDPVGVLQRRVRKDLGQTSALSDRLKSEILAQYKAHPRWSYKLHVDNLHALLDEDPSLGRKPSYSTVRRFMKRHGLLKKKRRRRNTERPGAKAAAAQFESRETRSYEVAHVGGLWHLDFHHASRKIVTAEAEWLTPIALGIHDDHSRLCCHLQWYVSESAEDLVHGLCQAFAKRRLPRKILMDNGGAMRAQEVIEGLERLSIIQEMTLPYTPEQNGKEEVFWAQVEGRLVAMLEGVENLTLAVLNDLSQAWVEMEYNRSKNAETKETPIERLLSAPSVLRPCPSSERLRDAFRLQARRTQRRSDGTVMVEGVRFEVPSRFRNIHRPTVRYARWDLRNVHLVDERSGALLTPLYPLDRTANADGRRRPVAPLLADLPPAAARSGLPPLLRKLLAEYSATGLPPAYIPKLPRDGERNEP